MAQLFAANVYQINSLTPIPLPRVQKFLFPFSGILVRPIIDPVALTPGLLLSTGVFVYSQIQLLENGRDSIYLVVETPTVIQGLS